MVIILRIIGLRYEKCKMFLRTYLDKKGGKYVESVN